MRNVIVCILLLASVVASGTVFATSDKVLSYGGAGQGKVLFDGRLHASKGFVCNDCHSKIFATKKQALITMDDHGKAVACFVCHNGSKAFDDCDKCHRKF